MMDRSSIQAMQSDTVSEWVLRVWLCVLVLLPVSLLAVAAPAQAAIRSVAAPTISPTRTSPGATVTVGAQLSTKVVRPVELQSVFAGYWVEAATGRTTKQGVYRFAFRAPPDPGSYGYRVVARKVSSRVGRLTTRLPAVTTGVRTLTVQPPPVSLSFPPSPPPGGSPDPGTKVTLPAEREALIQLFDATDGEHWTQKEGWGSGEEPCLWSGVFCDLDAQVTSLYLDDNNLSGEIPDSLGDLPKLEHLYLFHNQLSGPIPISLGRLENLTELELNYNQLTGDIPTSLGALGRLEQLDLGANQLTGEIPASLGDLTKLENLYLFSNQLSGAIPSSLGDLAQLKALWLFYNQLAGDVPGQLGSLQKLESLDLGGNQLSGAIPSSLGGLGALNSLGVSENQLSGGIPAALGNLADLEVLDPSRNQLSGGSPASLGSPSKLLYLGLAYNQLSGPIPTSLGNRRTSPNWFCSTTRCPGRSRHPSAAWTNLKAWGWTATSYPGRSLLHWNN
jgi:hypothetical protein